MEIKAPPSLSLSGSLLLPASKSISNRALIIRAISGAHFSITNLSKSGDTITLERLLKNPSAMVDAGEGGTTLRFLMAYLALRGDEVTLTAAPSLRSRPLSALITALQTLGAEIICHEEKGKLPLTIKAGKLTGNKVTVAGDISSQFISALMLIAPALPGGLTIEMTGEILSVPYILMTISVMKHFGVEVRMENDRIDIPARSYRSADLTVEADWSAASYWYEAAALCQEAEIMLQGLSPVSPQGDAVIAKWMESLGVTTHPVNGGLMVRKTKEAAPASYFTADLSGTPDLGPALAATTGGLNITADLDNLKNFRLKESDRALSMQRGLYDLGVRTDFCGGSRFKVYGGDGIRFTQRTIRTYNDHRIAMAFAPLSLKTGSVFIDDPEVVKKSYPGFWEDWKSLGGITIP